MRTLVESSGGAGRLAILQTLGSFSTAEAGRALLLSVSAAGAAAFALLCAVEGNCGEEGLMEEETALRWTRAAKIDVFSGAAETGGLTRNFDREEPEAGFENGLEFTQVGEGMLLDLQRAAARVLCNLAVGEREGVRRELDRIGVRKGMCGDEMAEVYLEVLWEEEEEEAGLRGVLRK